MRPVFASLPPLSSSREDSVARSIAVPPAPWIRIFIKQAKVRVELALNSGRKLNCVIRITIARTLPSVMQCAARNKGFLLNEVINLNFWWVGEQLSPETAV